MDLLLDWILPLAAGVGFVIAFVRNDGIVRRMTAHVLGAFAAMCVILLAVALGGLWAAFGMVVMVLAWLAVMLWREHSNQVDVDAS